MSERAPAAAPPWKRALVLGALGALLALGPALVFWGFTVDDALISARYAAHLAHGLGYRFNAAGPVTDGVTPLGWPYLLAPFAAAGPLQALHAAKVLGLAAWTAGAALLAIAIDRVGGDRARFGALILLVASAPLGAWSVAGMETGLVIGLAASAVALFQLDRPLRAAACVGLAAALRPELIPWALVIAAAPSPASRASSRALRLVLAGFPAALVMAIRALVFGHLAPLSVQAKPADALLGAKYALACFLLAGPIALLAPFAIQRLNGFARILILSIAVHAIAIALAGGDWMPLSRLVAPILPAVVLAIAHLAAVADRRATAARLALALAGEIFQLVKVGSQSTHVADARLQVIEDLRAPLAGATSVAALDIGWLGAATDATIVDLAGLTDPEIAALPGGHTSKAIPRGLLDHRKVDAIVLLLKEGEPLASPWTESFFGRIVELRIAMIPRIGDDFAPVAVGQTPHLRYVVLRRVPEP